MLCVDLCFEIASLFRSCVLNWWNVNTLDVWFDLNSTGMGSTFTFFDMCRFLFRSCIEFGRIAVSHGDCAKVTLCSFYNHDDLLGFWQTDCDTKHAWNVNVIGLEELWCDFYLFRYFLSCNLYWWWNVNIIGLEELCVWDVSYWLFLSYNDLLHFF